MLFLFLWLLALWVISCSIASFIEWDNYFIYPLSEWRNGARFSFMVFYFIGIVVYFYFLNVVLNAENNIKKINDLINYTPPHNGS